MIAAHPDKKEPGAVRQHRPGSDQKPIPTKEQEGQNHETTDPRQPDRAEQVRPDDHHHPQHPPAGDPMTAGCLTGPVALTDAEQEALKDEMLTDLVEAVDLSTGATIPVQRRLSAVTDVFGSLAEQAEQMSDAPVRPDAGDHIAEEFASAVARAEAAGISTLDLLFDAIFLELENAEARAAEQADRKAWLDEPCPTWCTRPHTLEDAANEQVHDGLSHRVQLVDSGPTKEGRAPSFGACLRAPRGDRASTVIVQLDSDTGRETRAITPTDARKLGVHLILMADAADRVAVGGDRS